MITCNFCGKSFKNKKALLGHLQFCLERRKARDQWTRFAITEPYFSGDLCVVSRSKKPIPLIRARHEQYLAGEVTADSFIGFVGGMEAVGIIDVDLKRSDQDVARAVAGAGR